ncbi:class I SAM-dependent methyltransferase [Terrabacter sp. 2YAF2]|uniref:class I SAM-dependent methyltransferase n=1 Tax=Terrabacter sp. 2YAF2 TaxID=3233026 RepID=UPI003F972503
MGLRKRIFAATYDWQMGGAQRAGLADLRAGVVSRATGLVLEVGAGTGLNLPHYGPDVEHLTLTEPDPSMLKRLQRRVEQQPRSATVLRAPAERLPFDDDSFDTVVCTLVLCGVEDQPLAVREIRRVLRPGGQLLFLEHMRSEDERHARLQDRFNWLNRAMVMCDCNRPTRLTLASEGLRIEEIAETDFPKAPPFINPLVHGRATHPTPVGAENTTQTRADPT